MRSLVVVANSTQRVTQAQAPLTAWLLGDVWGDKAMSHRVPPQPQFGFMLFRRTIAKTRFERRRQHEMRQEFNHARRERINQSVGSNKIVAARFAPY